ncbi:MAG: hypothetical protein JWM11_316 [Planctomycetaceae bacterium]|nr:hypothetical protein [Planctomycetaceae bacterium]
MPNQDRTAANESSDFKPVSSDVVHVAFYARVSSVFTGSGPYLWRDWLRKSLMGSTSGYFQAAQFQKGCL